MAESKPVFDLLSLPLIWDIATELEWLVDDFIPENGVVMLSGKSGCGKSTLTLALADAVAHGSPFLNRTCKQRHVLIIDRENGLGVYYERLARLNIERNEKLLIWGLWNSPEPQGPHAAEIAEFVKKTKPLLIFDSFIAFHPGKESIADENRLYMDFFRKLAQLGATVVLIHHTGKGLETKEYRGSSDILASVDTAWLMSSGANLQGIKLKPYKCREGALTEFGVYFDGQDFSTNARNLEDVVRETIIQNPGINESGLISCLGGVVKERQLVKILREGELLGWLTSTRGAHNAKCYALK